MDKKEINVKIREDENRSFDFCSSKDWGKNLRDEKAEIIEKRLIWHRCSLWMVIF